MPWGDGKHATMWIRLVAGPDLHSSTKECIARSGKDQAARSPPGVTRGTAAAALPPRWAASAIASHSRVPLCDRTFAPAPHLPCHAMRLVVCRSSQLLLKKVVVVFCFLFGMRATCAEWIRQGSIGALCRRCHATRWLACSVGQRRHGRFRRTHRAGVHQGLCEWMFMRGAQIRRHNPRLGSWSWKRRGCHRVSYHFRIYDSFPEPSRMGCPPRGRLNHNLGMEQSHRKLPH